MSKKSSLFPQSSTSEESWRLPVKRLPIHGLWRSSSANLRDMNFLRSWMVYDSEADAAFKPRRINWRLVLGLALMVTVSASFWAGIGLLVAHIRK